MNASLTGTATFVAQEGQGYEVEMEARGAADARAIWVTGDTGRPATGGIAITPVTGPQSLPTVVMVFCADRKTPCFTRWDAFWETNAGAGQLDIIDTAALMGTFEVELRTDTGNVKRRGRAYARVGAYRRHLSSFNRLLTRRAR